MTKTEGGEEKREKKRKYSFNEPSNTKLNAKATEGKDDARFEGNDREGRDLLNVWTRFDIGDLVFTSGLFSDSSARLSSSDFPADEPPVKESGNEFSIPVIRPRKLQITRAGIRFKVWGRKLTRRSVSIRF